MNKTITSSILSAIGGIVVGAAGVGQVMGKRVKSINKLSGKHLDLFLMMNQWVKVKQDGKNLSQYFEKLGYKNIAIYGMSYAGETLVDELKNTDINVAYGIDKNATSKYYYTAIDILSTDDEFEEVDAIVVTAITFFDEIKETLSEKVNCPIISLEDILYEI